MWHFSPVLWIKRGIIIHRNPDLLGLRESCRSTICITYMTFEGLATLEPFVTVLSEKNRTGFTCIVLYICMKNSCPFASQSCTWALGLSFATHLQLMRPELAKPFAEVLTLVFVEHTTRFFKKVSHHEQLRSACLERICLRRIMRPALGRLTWTVLAITQIWWKSLMGFQMTWPWWRTALCILQYQARSCCIVLQCLVSFELKEKLQVKGLELIVWWYTAHRYTVRFKRSRVYIYNPMSKQEIGVCRWYVECFTTRSFFAVSNTL